MFKDSLYYAKILLFGEYGIIEDSMGLSIPFHSFKGSLIIPNSLNQSQANSNDELHRFLEHLLQLEQNKQLPCKLDLAAFETDIKNGMYFESSIPQGFGVGSSGALVAAVYDKYCSQKIAESTINNGENMLQLKAILGNLESFFHGKSSGLDPLICFLNLPILIKSKSDVGAVAIPAENANGKGAIFLLDSGSPGKTQNMVALFLEKLKNDGFRNMVKTQLKKYNDECIKAFLNSENKTLFENLKELSKILLENFSPMIPNKFEKIWKKGIETNAYYLKLCGSGGGGFVLGFTKNIEEAEKLLAGEKLNIIHRF